jgi:hypothetical protein
MGIRLEDQALLLTLDDALASARSTEELSAVWIARVERLGGFGIKTYIAALGGALLAKATDPRVDSLAQDEAAGPRGYSLRKAAEFLAQQNNGRFHLGAEGRWPLNNSPFRGGPVRIDDFTKVSGKARPAYEAFLDALRDLNRLERTEALDALASFLRVRMAVQDAEREAVRTARRMESELALEDLVGIVDRFVRVAPEGGRRAQALAAAVLDCAFDDIFPVHSLLDCEISRPAKKVKTSGDNWSKAVLRPLALSGSKAQERRPTDWPPTRSPAYAETHRDIRTIDRRSRPGTRSCGRWNRSRGIPCG